MQTIHGKRRLFTALLGAALALATALPAKAREALELLPAELQARLESDTPPVVIDVRTEAEFEQGHIPGAVNIPFDQVAERIGEVDAAHGFALYCMVGPRARKGEAALIEAGHASVFHLEGGLSAWKAAGLPVAVGDGD